MCDFKHVSWSNHYLFMYIYIYTYIIHILWMLTSQFYKYVTACYCLIVNSWVRVNRRIWYLKTSQMIYHHFPRLKLVIWGTPHFQTHMFPLKDLWKVWNDHEISDMFPWNYHEIPWTITILHPCLTPVAVKRGAKRGLAGSAASASSTSTLRLKNALLGGSSHLVSGL